MGGCENGSAEHRGTWPLPAAASWVSRVGLGLSHLGSPALLLSAGRETQRDPGALWMHFVLHG